MDSATVLLSISHHLEQFAPNFLAKAAEWQKFLNLAHHKNRIRLFCESVIDEAFDEESFLLTCSGVFSASGNDLWPTATAKRHDTHVQPPIGDELALIAATLSHLSDTLLAMLFEMYRDADGAFWGEMAVRRAPQLFAFVYVNCASLYVGSMAAAAASGTAACLHSRATFSTSPLLGVETRSCSALFGRLSQLVRSVSLALCAPSHIDQLFCQFEDVFVRIVEQRATIVASRSHEQMPFCPQPAHFEAIMQAHAKAEHRLPYKSHSVPFLAYFSLSNVFCRQHALKTVGAVFATVAAAAVCFFVFKRRRL